MSYTYSFQEQQVMSEGVAKMANVTDILLSIVPGAISVTRAEKHDDKNGTDYWIHRTADRPLSIDVKARKKDFSIRGHDDLALETFSVMEVGKIGWTLDVTKQTDYILWLWEDTGRWCLVPFPLLCAVFQEHRDEWYQKFRHEPQFTPTSHGGYHSECLFVDRRLIWRTIYQRFAGTPQ